MSAARRVILLMLSFCVAASMLSLQMGVDVVVPRDQAQREGRGSNASASVKSAPLQSAVPSANIVPTVVTIVARPAGHASFEQPVVPRSSEAIARELQKELKRVGCYAGRLNGEWTRSTREAMKDFSDRVNAKLPIDKPDSILLALVHGHSEKVCGVPCPSGQSPDRIRQCTPNALLAASTRTKVAAGSGQAGAQATSAWTVTTTVAGGAPVPWTGTDPGDVTPTAPPPSAGPPLQERAPHRVVRSHWQPTPRHEGTWAATFFKLRDRLGFN